MTTVLARPDRQCGATNRQGERCRNFALRGARVCRFHGGRAPNVKAAAARREAERQAVVALSKHKSTPVDNPLAAFRDLAGEVIAVKDWLRQHVERLEQIRYQGGSGEQIRGELQAYTTALDACRRVLADYGRLNIDERLTAIDEQAMAEYTKHAFEGFGFAMRFLIPDEFRSAAMMVTSHVLRTAWEPGGSPRPTGETAEKLAEWQAHLAAAARVPVLEAELAESRAEAERLRLALVQQLAQRPGGPLAIEASKPAEPVPTSVELPDFEGA